MKLGLFIGSDEYRWLFRLGIELTETGVRLHLGFSEISSAPHWHHAGNPVSTVVVAGAVLGIVTSFIQVFIFNS